MRLQTYILFWVCLTRAGSLFAQWTEKDSIWIQKVLEGEEEIRLNPEAMKAIESGTLISTDIIQPKDQMMMDQSLKLPISKDFSDYIKPDRKERIVDPWSMPPMVYKRYYLDVPLPKTYRAFIVPDEIKKNGTKPSGTSFDDALKSVFSAKERARQRARRNANAWKNYNRFP